MNQPGQEKSAAAPTPDSPESVEARLRHAQKLEAIGRLAAGIAHDFNNLLTVIQGHATLLRADTTLRPEAQESVQQIARAAERAAKFTSQLLAISRRKVMAPRPLPLNELLANLGELLRRTLGEDVTCQFSHAADLPLVFADAAMLEQIVLNLAANAREAMPGGGQLLISTAVADVGAADVARHPADARTGRFVCLSVTDTGSGMDAQTLGHVFEPFFTTKEFGKGAGLGLATAYGIAKQHHGWIEAHSSPGRGSTFKVFLPPAGDQSAPDAKSPEASVPRGTETVLVVEDESSVRWVIKDVLGKYGYAVLEAGNGVEALGLWRQHQADIALLLTDMVMPVGLNGQELAEKFTAQKPALKVMFISGYSLHVAGRAYAVMDGLNFLQKPFDGARLAHAVRHCLDA